MRIGLIALLAWPFFSACIAVENAAPQTTWNVDAATKFVRRGMVQVDNDVLQGTMNTALPVRGDGRLDFNVFGNLDMHEDAGDAWFPGGDAGRFSEIDLGASYTRTVGAVDLTAGITSYNLPRGNLFLNGERGSTTEVSVTGALDVSGFRPRLEVHYDYDEVDGFYIRGGVSRAFPINEKLTADVDVSLAYTDQHQSFWNYGVPDGFGGAGLADLQGTGRLRYAFDAHTTLQLLIAGSTIVDKDIRDWFDVIGIDKNNLWAGLGVEWSF